MRPVIITLQALDQAPRRLVLGNGAAGGEMNHSDAQRLRVAALRKTTISTRTALRRLVIGFAVIVATAGAATPARASADTSEFRGVNWADPRDNYADDEVVPSGLSAQDTYATTYRKAVWHRGRIPTRAAGEHDPPADQPVECRDRLVEVLPRRDRRLAGRGLQGDPELLGGRQRQGRPRRRPGRPSTPCGTRWSRPTPRTRASTSSR